MESGADRVVIVEFPVEAGVQQIARSPEDLARKSGEALDRAMETIQGMSTRLARTVDDMVRRPSSVELEFGVKLTAEAGAIVSKIGGEAALNVRLTWESPQPPSDASGR
jgi:hypothetical protein